MAFFCRLLLLPNDVRDDAEVREAIQLDSDNFADLSNGCRNFRHDPVHELWRGRQRCAVQRVAYKLLLWTLHVCELLRALSTLRYHVLLHQAEGVAEGQEENQIVKKSTMN